MPSSNAMIPISTIKGRSLQQSDCPILSTHTICKVVQGIYSTLDPHRMQNIEFRLWQIGISGSQIYFKSILAHSSQKHLEVQFDRILLIFPCIVGLHSKQLYFSLFLLSCSYPAQKYRSPQTFITRPLLITSWERSCLLGRKLYSYITTRVSYFATFYIVYIII